ncbi:hypothetical protein BJX99DRAFT_259912 [Aspergillus californicus]
MAPRNPPIHSDVILPMQDPYMDQIINGQKHYEFRKYCLKPSVRRIWFYRTAPNSSITHVCETFPARTRNPGDAVLAEDGLGNAEFNKRDSDETVDWKRQKLLLNRKVSKVTHSGKSEFDNPACFDCEGNSLTKE